MMLEVKTFDMEGKERRLTDVYEEIGPFHRAEIPASWQRHRADEKREGDILSLRAAG